VDSEKVGVRFLSVDVAFAASGLVVFDVSLDQTLTPVYAGVVKSESEKKAKRRFTYKAEEDIQRCQTLAQGVFDTAKDFGVDAVVMEIPNGGAISARAARTMGAATGVMATLAWRSLIPYTVVFPNDWHQLAFGRIKKITKQEVIDWVSTKWPAFPWPKNTTEHEHVADAAGVAWYFLGHQTCKTLMRARGMV
jgi:hypothetical protein